MSCSVYSVAGWGLKKQLMDVFDSQSLCHQLRHGQCHGDTTWDGDFGMLAPGASKVDGSSSWLTVLVSGLVMGDPSGGGEGLLFAFAGVLSLKEVERERGREGEREGKKKREKSEPGLGGVVLTGTDQWPRLSLCFTAQIHNEDIWGFWEASLLSHSQSNTLQQHYFAAGYSPNAYRIDTLASNTEKQKQNNQASLILPVPDLKL